MNISFSIIVHLITFYTKEAEKTKMLVPNADTTIPLKLLWI